MKKWFITFLTEKGFYKSEQSDLLLEGAKDKDMMIGLTVEMMIDFICKHPQAGYIKEQYITLDFLNGDCLDLWKHHTNGFMLACGYDKQYNDVKGEKKAA